MKKLQSGRSMIEMLGVLAIIGVLSIGGLAGYTMAMNRHRANEILDYAAKCGVMVQTDGTASAITSSTGACNGSSYMNTTNYPNGATSIIATRDGNGENTLVTVIFSSQAVEDAFTNRTGIGELTNHTAYLYVDDNGRWSATAPTTNNTNNGNG